MAGMALETAAHLEHRARRKQLVAFLSERQFHAGPPRERGRIPAAARSGPKNWPWGEGLALQPRTGGRGASARGTGAVAGAWAR